jgi:hypothetical protein
VGLYFYVEMAELAVSAGNMPIFEGLKAEWAGNVPICFCINGLFGLEICHMCLYFYVEMADLAVLEGNMLKR